MRIEDGIVYADDPMPILRVKSIKLLEDYRAQIEFNNNDVRIFDFSSLIQRPLYQPLKDKKIFNSVSLEYGVPVWNDGEIDISPEYLYDNGTMKIK